MRFVLSAPLPPPICDVLTRSTLDGQSARFWLKDLSVATVRKACLLNILAALCVHPAKGDPLIGLVGEVFAVKDERLYAAVDPVIGPRLETLVADPRQPFYADPSAPLPIHYDMLQSVPERLHPAQVTTLKSYRSEGRPSLQLVIAATQGETLADIDLDLFPATQDVVGFLGHEFGEILPDVWRGWHGRPPVPTDHLALRAKLAHGPAGAYLGYTLDDHA